MKRSLAVQKMSEKMAKSNHRQISQSNEPPNAGIIEVGLSWPIKNEKRLLIGWISAGNLEQLTCSRSCSEMPSYSHTPRPQTSLYTRQNGRHFLRCFRVHRQGPRPGEDRPQGQGDRRRDRVRRCPQGEKSLNLVAIALRILTRLSGFRVGTGDPWDINRRFCAREPWG